jgi:hypothetical protein
MFGIDESTGAAALLRLGDGMQRKCGLAGTFRPYTSMILPRGRPPTPSAISRPSEPEGMTSICSLTVRAPMRMIEPLPKARSICVTAASSALFLSAM